MLLPSAKEYIKECSKQKEWAVNPNWNSETPAGVFPCDKWHITSMEDVREGEGEEAVRKDWKADVWLIQGNFSSSFKLS